MNNHKPYLEKKFGNNVGDVMEGSFSEKKMEHGEIFISNLLINSETDPLILPTKQTSSVVTQKTPYRWYLIALDITLLAFAAWSQFGFTFYSQENSLESLSDPLERYVYPHISSEQIEEIAFFLNYLTHVLAYADAGLTVGTYVNMRHTRNELIEGLKKGLDDYRNKKISPLAFIASSFLILGSFVAGSFAPWTGLKRGNYDEARTKFFGPTMFVGLMISFLMSHAPYIFSASKAITDFYKLEWEHKKEILHNVFLTKKGLLGFLARSVISVVNRSMVFYGSAMLATRWLFKIENPYFIYSYATFAGVSAGYQTFTSQSIKDYKIIFDKSETTDNTLSIVKKSKPKDMSYCNKIGFYSLSLLLIFLVITVFIQRTLAIPSLYTGEIDDAAQDYDYKDTSLSLLGLAFGAYSAFQYTRYRYSRWQDSFSAFFKPKAIESKDQEKNAENSVPVIRN